MDVYVYIGRAAIEAHREPALAPVGAAGRKDAPYVAAVLAVDGRLWTHDKTLAAEVEGETVTTKELLDEGSP